MRLTPLLAAALLVEGCASTACTPVSVVVERKEERTRVRTESRGVRTGGTGAVVEDRRDVVVPEDWVKNLVGQKEVEIDQKMGAQGQKVTLIETKLGSVETATGEARTRADGAYSRADEVNERLSRLWTSRHKRPLVETVHVQFAFDKWDLTDGAQTALLQIVKDLKTNPNLTVDLEGYTDPTGPQAYNIGLSQRRGGSG